MHCFIVFPHFFLSSIWGMQNIWSEVGLLRRNKCINQNRILQGTVLCILFSRTWTHMYCQRRHLVLQLIPRLTLGSVVCTGSPDVSLFRSHIFRFMTRSGHSPFRASRSRTGVWKLLFSDGWWVEKNADLQWVPHYVAYDAHLANYILYSRFLHNMICCHNTLFKKMN